MSILCDIDIHTLARRELVTPFDPGLVNPASLDVRLGENLLVELPSTPKLMPFSIAGQLALKSSRAREGIEHLLAWYIDPGYCGRLTLELQNARMMHPVALWPGMRIAQIVFHRMTMLPAKDYSMTGRYQGDKAVQGSRG